LRLEYPNGLSPSERNDAQRRVSRFPPELAQQLLDELAARLKAGTIRISPLVYLAGLIKRANAGKFVQPGVIPNLNLTRRCRTTAKEVNNTIFKRALSRAC